MELKYIVKKEYVGKTIKEVCLSYFKISHRLLITLKKNECVYLNGKKAFIYNIVNLNDIITINLDYEEDNTNIIPKKIPLNIIYEDEWFLVVDKKENTPIHPSMDHFEDSLSNGIRYYFDSINLKKKIRIVNRLDKDTSGLVIFAKCEYIQEELIKQMNKNIFTKEYITIVEGYFKEKQGNINLPIARKEGSIIERCINENGDTAITEYEVLKELEFKSTNISIVKCKLLTRKNTSNTSSHVIYRSSTFRR